MLRVQTVLNHIKRPTTNDIDSIYNISSEYRCRFIKESDYDSIMELTKDVFYGNDWVGVSFHRLLSDKKIIFVGVEYIPESKIVSTRVIKILDNGLTGMICGSRTHKLHRRKGLNLNLIQWNNNWMQKMFPKIKRMRAATPALNIASIKLRKKAEGMLPVKDENFIKILFGEIVYKPTQNYIKIGAITPAVFENSLNSLKAVRENKVEFRTVNNAHIILDIIKYKYGKNEIFLDWKPLDLNIAFNDTVKYLQIEIDSKRCNVICTDGNLCVAMIYIDERKKAVQLHMYGVGESDNISSILLLNNVFKEWKNEIDKVIKNDLYVMWIYMDEDLIVNSQMKQICDQFCPVVVTQKYV
eukprot:469672_1